MISKQVLGKKNFPGKPSSCTLCWRDCSCGMCIIRFQMGSLKFIHSNLMQGSGGYVQKYRWANLPNLNSSGQMRYGYDA